MKVCYCIVTNKVEMYFIIFNETCDLTPILINTWYYAYVQEQDDNIRKVKMIHLCMELRLLIHKIINARHEIFRLATIFTYFSIVG